MPSPGIWHRTDSSLAVRASRLRLKVVPGSSRTEIVGWLGERLKIRVAAAPEGGKANAAIEAYLVRVLNTPRNGVRIVAGHGSAYKTVEVQGLSPSALGARLPPMPRN
jgi:uncharacterized protein YggU (UPF0235/DUF167 family)